ncbi:MAG: LysR family transcriptional regulator, partial [Pseudomonadota bacterium]
GSLVKASQQLNVTQSTVTARLKSLEEELGQSLINRQKSGATVTAAGERLRRYAGTIADLWRQARQETALPDAMSSVCNIGCHPDLWANLGERLFETIRQNYPQVALSVWHGREEETTRWLDGGLTDISLTYWPNANQMQVSSALVTDKLVLVTTEQDEQEKSKTDYVFVEAGEDFGKQHAATFADANATRISFGNAQLGLEHILKHGGSAYLPKRIVEPYLERKQLFLSLRSPVFERNAFIVINKSATKNWPWFENVIAGLSSLTKA